METQERWFARHFELAAEARLPMFLHLRGAAPAFFRILEAQVGSMAVRGVVHSFDGSWEEAQQALAVPGLSIGLNGCSLKTGRRAGGGGGPPRCSCGMCISACFFVWVGWWAPAPNGDDWPGIMGCCEQDCRP